MQISPILWLAAAVGFLALEASTFNMTSIWFAIGSAAALLCCVCTGSFRGQAVGFLVLMPDLPEIFLVYMMIFFLCTLRVL